MRKSTLRIQRSLIELLSILCRRLSDFSGLDLFNVVMSYVKAGHASEPLMKAIATEIIRRPSHFPVELLVGIAHAYASVDCRNPALFYTIANKCLEGGCNELNPKGIASLAWSFATLDVFHSPLLGALADASEGRWDEFNARSLASMAWAFAKAREDRPHLFESVTNAAIARRDEFEPQSISMLLWACSDVGHLDQRLFESLASVAAASLKESSAQGLATISWAYAVADVDAPCLFNDAFIDACVEKESEVADANGSFCASFINTMCGEVRFLAMLLCHQRLDSTAMMPSSISPLGNPSCKTMWYQNWWQWEWILSKRH